MPLVLFTRHRLMALSHLQRLVGFGVISYYGADPYPKPGVPATLAKQDGP